MARADSIVIAGAGAAGLSLAYYLASAQSGDVRCLLVDPDPKESYDRTWSYWGGPFEFDHLVAHRWSELELRTDDRAAVSSFGATPACTYRFIRSDDFYRACRSVIEHDARFTFLRGRVESYAAGDAGVCVCVRGHDGVRRDVATDYLVDSVFGPPVDSAPAPEPLHQSFVGWEVETRGDAFNPDRATLMDFTAGGSAHALEFLYVLPFSPRRALVEYTTVDARSPDADYLEDRLADRLDRDFGSDGWHVAHREKGEIPLFDDRSPGTSAAGRVVHLGVRAGAARPTTGYAFRSIVETSRALAACYAETGCFDPAPGRTTGRLASPVRTTPWGVTIPTHAAGRPRFYDRVFLDVLRHEPGTLPRALVGLFARNPPERVLRFLAGESTLLEEAAIIAGLPWWPFLRAAGRLAGTRFAPGRGRGGVLRRQGAADGGADLVRRHTTAFRGATR